MSVSSASYTKVNKVEMQLLEEAINNCKLKCSQGLENFKTSMEKIRNNQYLEGVATEVLNTSVIKIEETNNKFIEWCDKLLPQIKNITAATDTIETEYQTLYQDLISINPTNFS